ncbi:MAG: hypothetical protein PHE93_04010 [Clostridia bacterium]|nr:hypothetical protein [Clostridia bacterium]
MAKDKLPQQEKAPKVKPPKLTKEEQKAQKELIKSKAQEHKAWEASIVANKKVKREINRRRMRRIVLAIMIMSLMITSSAYIILLLVQENSIRISATYANDKSIGISIDRENWMPYLDVKGPDAMWNISYDSHVADSHGVQTVPSWDTALSTIGNFSVEDAYIGVTFFVKNTCELDYTFTSAIELEHQINGLDEAIRIMWTMQDETTGALLEKKVYAKKSDYAGLRFNDGIEFIAYPDGYFAGTFIMYDDEEYPVGLVPTTPFLDDSYAMRTEGYSLASGALIRCSLVIWIEGSDPECTSSVLNSYLKLGVKFSVDDEVATEEQDEIENQD